MRRPIRTTRIRAGYNMVEVDAFLDQVEDTIAYASSEGQRLGDEVEALRSQVRQLQRRLAAAQRELQEAQSTPVAATDEGHATVITLTDDGASTTENVVVGDVPPVGKESLLRFAIVCEKCSPDKSPSSTISTLTR